ncbi:bifunctional metallophosphatase/5'-nucleotidase [Nocardioides aquiterrae]|uniref:Bifunctional metallophosphatase/5'-nucleotidase n=1 Tax=Nocardioides aquiterrae TaxID=203799 RepID=A0ABP4F043_9ACTN
MQPNRRTARAIPVAAALTSLVLAGAAATTASAAPERNTDQSRTAGASGLSAKTSYAKLAGKSGKKDLVKLDLLAFNDFHGNLEPPSSSSGRVNNTNAGGAAYLGRLLADERAKSRAAGAVPITVSAGDIVGASPLLSAAFHDEPTIKVMNALGLQVASVGNHEFDEGWRELRRLQHGGCLDDGTDGANGQNSCPGDQDFAGAKFRYLAANVGWTDPSAHKSKTLFPATKIMKVKGEKVGFIGMTLEGTPDIVTAAGVQGLTFSDEVETANALVPQLKKKGVKSIVVLLHEGALPTDATAYNSCSGVSGDGLAIAQDLSPAIDVVVSGHTHQPYNCVVQDPSGQPRLFTSAYSFGRMVTKLHLLIDPKTHDIVRPAAFAENLIAMNGESVSPLAKVQSIIDTYKALVSAIADKVIGHIADGSTITKAQEADGESPLGDLIADGQVADPTTIEAGASGSTADTPVIALMNPGGIRVDLVENEAGDVTYGGAFAVQPFNNFMVSMDLTGAQIKAILNQQWNGANESGRKILQVSGLTYTWDASDAALPDADALVPGTVLVDADADPATPMVPIEDGTTYRVVANNFLAGGGDGFAGFKDATNTYFGGLDVDSLRMYLEAHDPVATPVTDRITKQD